MGTDYFMGIKGKEFVMVCSDTSAAHSIITIKHDEDKIVPIDDHKVFCLSGEAGDRVNFSEYIIANVKLNALRNGTKLSTKSVAHYTRGELATALRKVRSRHLAWSHGASELDLTASRSGVMQELTLNTGLTACSACSLHTTATSSSPATMRRRGPRCTGWTTSRP